MTKNKHRQQPIPNATSPSPSMPPTVSPPPGFPPGFTLGYNPSGPKEPVDIVSSKDGWSEFQLADGTVVRAKAVVLDVKKMVGQYNTEGEPIYELQLTMVNQTRVPPELIKK